MSASPPRARLAFRVGLVGHRPNRLPDDPAQLAILRQTIGGILREVREAVRAEASVPGAELYAGAPPLLRAISSLAEGSDRIFADEALELGFELTCPLPFCQEEFEQDFLPPNALEADSLASFRALLGKAQAKGALTLFELDGVRETAPDAYAAASQVVLNQSDLLIGVWDGGAAAGRGSTVDTLEEALAYHVPVLWIDPAAPEHWQLLPAMPDQDASLVAKPGSEEVIRRIVALEVTPGGEGGARALSHAADYFAEPRRRWNFAFFWALFRAIAGGGGMGGVHLRVSDFETAAKAEWPLEAEDPKISPVSDWINTQLRAHFAWADGLADFYGDAHRSGFVLSYLLSAGAVFTALLPFAAAQSADFETGCAAAELVILAVILFLLGWARIRHWHERWTEYRLLAELIRALRFLVPLGGGRPLPRLPAHLIVYGDPAHSWMYWHMRAIARQVGIPAARVSDSYVRDCLEFLACMVGDAQSGQWGFHLRAAQRAEWMGSRLKVAALALFVITILGVGFRLALRLMHAPALPLDADRWLVLLAAALPALGAALEGIGNQGEFIRIGKRSRAMAAGFQAYAARIAALNGKTNRLAEVIPLAGGIAKAMVDEVVDWRTVFIDRPQ